MAETVGFIHTISIVGLVVNAGIQGQAGEIVTANLPCFFVWWYRDRDLMLLAPRTIEDYVCPYSVCFAIMRI
jgi:hypothetical protein